MMKHIYSKEEALRQAEKWHRYAEDRRRRFLIPVLKFFNLFEEPTEEQIRREEICLMIFSWTVSIAFAAWIISHIKL